MAILYLHLGVGTGLGVLCPLSESNHLPSKVIGTNLVPVAFWILPQTSRQKQLLLRPSGPSPHGGHVYRSPQRQYGESIAPAPVLSAGPALHPALGSRPPDSSFSLCLGPGLSLLHVGPRSLLLAAQSCCLVCVRRVWGGLLGIWKTVD